VNPSPSPWVHGVHKKGSPTNYLVHEKSLQQGVKGPSKKKKTLHLVNTCCLPSLLLKRPRVQKDAQKLKQRAICVPSLARGLFLFGGTVGWLLTTSIRPSTRSSRGCRLTGGRETGPLVVQCRTLRPGKNTFLYFLCKRSLSPGLIFNYANYNYRNAYG